MDSWKEILESKKGKNQVWRKLGKLLHGQRGKIYILNIKSSAQKCVLFFFTKKSG